MENSRISLSIRALIDLDSQTFSLFSPGYQPLIRRFAAGYPQHFRQAFRGKSAAFPRVFHIGRPLDFSAFFSQRLRRKLRTRPKRKMAKSKRNRIRCGKAGRGSGWEEGSRFSAEIQN